MHRSCRITAGFGKKEITKVACFFSEATAKRPKRDSEAYASNRAHLVVKVYL